VAVFYHGSRVVLPVGTRLTSLREREGTALAEFQYEYIERNDHNPDLVYFTTDLQLARAWCARDAGAVFRVDPVGAYEPDPDYPNTSFSAAAAIIEEIVEYPVSMSPLSVRKAFAAYDPDAYDESGFIRPEVRLPEMFIASGQDVAVFRRLGGRYPNPMRFHFKSGQIRYLTDDVELLAARALIDQGLNQLTEEQYQAALAHARTTNLGDKPIRWL
jgi:hypothetical protein